MAFVRVDAVDAGDARRAPGRLAVAEPPPSVGGPASIEPIANAKTPPFVRRRLGAARNEISALEAILRAGPSEAAASVQLAKACIGLGRFSGALKVLRVGAAAGDVPAIPPAESASLFFEMGLYSDAIRLFAEAIAIGPDDAAALLRSHRVALSALGEDSRRGVSPQGKAMYLEAMELLVRSRFADAETKFGKLTRYHPGFVPGWLGWRGALEAQAKSDAIKPLERAWRVFSPRSQWAVGPVMSRRLSPRGLVFDPREAIPIRPTGETLRPVGAPRDLDGADDAILTLDPGGEALELEPVIPLASAPGGKTRFSYIAAPKHLASIEGAALVGRGLVLNRNGETPEELKPPCYLGKVGLHEADGHIVADPLAFRDGHCPIEVFDTPALLMAGPTDSGFGDWTLNFPPRLSIAAAAGLDCPIVVRAGRPESWLRMLEALGVRRERIILHDPRGVSVFAKLYVPSWPLPLRSQPMRGLFDVYRGLARPPDGHRGERLYLSREGMAGRKLVNEAEIRAVFERRGFRTVRPERLSFERAQALFSRAEMIGGGYGSAYLNLAAYGSRPRGVLALMPPAVHGFLDEIALWIGASGNRFGYLFGDPAGPSPDAWSLSVEVVEAALDELLKVADQRQGE